MRKILDRVHIALYKLAPSGKLSSFLELVQHFAAIAQLVEQLICNHQVPGSTPGGGTT